YLLRHFKATEPAERLLSDLLAPRELDALCKESVQALLRLPTRQNHVPVAAAQVPAKPVLLARPTPAKLAKPRPTIDASYGNVNKVPSSSAPFRRAQEAVQRGDLKAAEVL